ncbi:serine/threonine protein kinase with WD-40 repeats [Tolypothrix tenuis PCC 7101]|uniref:Serine/threonine protein kinase with WD-40 repeats n=1 Tax=Tolypothrix tenuis PCC 7101 TaxID=231146 RepID=A0A1Z4N6U0_9CYAN|nr:serine/threonine protein kinase [Aulosira sp. FACHB-113]BAZ01424.1 serine/threonine protein kinase with WD-40 repeats [Tolypothrix tenuis PCC 7101]BAZ74653.1 serine/threonine protein kinase with WD-40 repeats [Aulosira laxa NIES-50]
MICCLNPDCPNPLNPDRQEVCLSCHQPLISLLRGRYRVIKVLSDEGGFGRTYLAEDADKLNEWCVVKQFAPKIQDSSTLKKAVELFKDEAKQLQKLGEHPQIPTLLAYFEQDNYLFLVQQYINGHNLLQELRQGIIYNKSKIVELLLDLLPVLKFIHERGVIHRDIKPQNIIRRQIDGRLVLIDFGSSKQLTATVHTQIGTTIGSHGYTPIEQMQDGKAYPSSDLFSLGVTCFHLLSGIRPSQLWMQKGYSWVNSWHEYLANQDRDGVALNVNVDKVLDKLLKTEIDQRYHSADEVIKDLTYKPLLVPPTIIEPASRTQSFYLKHRLLINTAILLLGLGGIWYLQSRPQEVTRFANPNQPANITENSDQPQTLKGHASDVNAVAFATDGLTLASGSDDNTIKLWNIKNNQEIRTLKGHKKWIWAVAFSPDGKTLASGSADKTIKLWNLANGEVINTLKAHTDGISSIAFSPDGKTLASSSIDKTINLWNVSNGQLIRTFKGHKQAVSALAFSPDGSTLASGSWDKTIKLWNVATGKEIRNFVGHSELIISVAFSPDGLTLASGSKDKSIKLWNLVTGETIRTLKGHTDKVNSVVYVPKTGDSKTSNNFTLISGSSDNTIKLWDTATGKEIRTLKRDSGYIYSVAISPDGKTIASGGSADNIIKVWHLSQDK